MWALFVGGFVGVLVSLLIGFSIGLLVSLFVKRCVDVLVGTSVGHSLDIYTIHHEYHLLQVPLLALSACLVSILIAIVIVLVGGSGGI